MGCVVFLTKDFTETAAASYASSENASYPLSNAQDKYRRTKVWRSAGYWDLTDNDRTIVFRESVGVDLTATIAATSYSSDSAFLAAIKTALDAAGASTYTVSRDTSTNKIKILSDLTGGGGIFQLRMELAASADMANAMGFDLVAYTGASNYIADALRIHSYEFLKWDFGVATNPKAFVLSDDRNLGLNISTQAVIKLQGNPTDSWSAPLYEETLTHDDFNLFQYSATGLHTTGLRYWRIYIQDYANPDGYIQAGLFYLGDAIDFERGSAQFPMVNTLADLSQTVFSEGGQSFTDRRSQSDLIQLEMKHLNVDDSESMELIYQQYGTFKPFWVSIDSNQIFSTNKRRWVKYVRLNQEPQKNLVRPGNFSASIELKEFL